MQSNTTLIAPTAQADVVARRNARRAAGVKITNPFSIVESVEPPSSSPAGPSASDSTPRRRPRAGFATVAAAPENSTAASQPIADAASDDAADDEDGKMSNQRAARLVAQQIVSTTRFNHTANAWMYFDGQRWCADRKKATQHRISQLLRTIAERSDTKFMRDVLPLLQANPMLAVTSDEFDTDPWLLATPGGYIDLRTGAMLPPDPAKLVTRLAAVKPDGSRVPRQWFRALLKWTNGDRDLIEHMQRMCGYMLTGDTREQVLWFLYGPGGTGKSTFIDTVAGIVGDYHTAGNVGALLASRGDAPQGPSPFITALVGCRVTTMPETKSGMAFDVPTIAKLAGDDRLTVRALHANPITFRMQGKIMIYGNERPTVSGSSSALARRINVIPFKVTFKTSAGKQPMSKGDNQLAAKLRAEWPAILAWMIAGCSKWQRDGLRVPASVIAESREYMRDADIVRSWLDDNVVSDPNGVLRTDHAFISWTRWCDANGHHAGSSRSFGHKLVEHLGPSSQVNWTNNGKSTNHRGRYSWRLK